MPNFQDELIAPPTTDQVAAFWEQLPLPHQTDDNALQFTNDIVTAEWFAKNTKVIAELAGLAEVLEEDIANLRVHLRRHEYELYRFKTKVLAQHYDRITKSADRVIQDAFLRRVVAETQQERELSAIEETIEDLRKRIEIREPRRDQLYSRLKALRDAQDSAKQYLDHAKLERRIQASNGGQLL